MYLIGINIWLCILCQVDRLSQDHQRECGELQANLDRLENELQLVRTKSKQKIETLETQYDQLKASSEETCAAIVQELK